VPSVSVISVKRLVHILHLTNEYLFRALCQRTYRKQTEYCDQTSEQQFRHKTLPRPLLMPP
jgi:hypothetical protein